MSELARTLLPLREAGVEVVDDASLEGPRSAFVRDPFGNQIQLVECPRE